MVTESSSKGEGRQTRRQPELDKILGYELDEEHDGKRSQAESDTTCGDGANHRERSIDERTEVGNVSADDVDSRDCPGGTPMISMPRPMMTALRAEITVRLPKYL